jgi:hypothetical protein
VGASIGNSTVSLKHLIYWLSSLNSDFAVGIVMKGKKAIKTCV